jgi:hypothetical protein
MTYPFRKTVFDCKQATLLSIKRDQGNITLFERVKLSYHLLYCSPCRRFISQSQQLDRAGKELDKNLSAHPPFLLPESAKERIQKIIETP